MSGLSLTSVSNASLIKYEEAAEIQQKVPGGVYRIIADYAGPTLWENPAAHRGILNGLRSVPFFESFYIPENLPESGCAGRLRDLFLEVADFAELDTVSPHLQNLAEENFTVFGEMCVIVIHAMPVITSSFLHLFEKIANENDAAFQFIKPHSDNPNRHALADIARGWMRNNPKELEKIKKVNFTSNEKLRDDPMVLKVFPREITWLCGLTSLELCLTLIRSLPSEIESLKELTELVVNGSEIRRFPASMGQLKKLERFSAQFCKHLEIFPETLGDLPKLKRLELYFSEGLPERLGVQFPEPKKPHFYSWKKVEQPPILPAFLEKLRKQGCKILL